MKTLKALARMTKLTIKQARKLDSAAGAVSALEAQLAHSRKSLDQTLQQLDKVSVRDGRADAAVSVLSSIGYTFEDGKWVSAVGKPVARVAQKVEKMPSPNLDEREL